MTKVMENNLKADKILLSTAIFTGLEDTPIAGGVAICGNKIIAVGSKDLVYKCKDENTTIKDYGNQMIIAGFCDAHVHLILSSLFTNETDLSAAKSAKNVGEILLAEFNKKASQYEADEWVLGFSWCNFNWDNPAYPTKEVLDEFFPDRPVFLLNSDAHGAWVNSKALEVAGVDKNTKDVVCGEIFRDSEGNPTGYLSENAMSLCIKQAYNLPKAKERKLIKNALPLFARVGITAVNDMQFFFGQNMGSIPIYEELVNSGELTMRINFANGMFDTVKETLAYSQKYQEGLVCHNGVKEFIDGIITTHTGYMLAPYADAPEVNYQYELMDLTKAKAAVIEIHKLGINIHLHATGDGAVRFAVDCYAEAIKANGNTGSRMSVEHCDLTDSIEWERMGKLGIIASVQPQHITLSSSLETNEYPKVVGPERCTRLWAFNSMEKNGVNLAFGTDYPLVELDPIKGLCKATTRLFGDARPEGGWNAHEKISLSHAIKAYTLGGAYKNGKEAILGSLEPGKLADIVVIDHNLFELSLTDLPKAKVVMTMVDGKVVYSAKE